MKYKRFLLFGYDYYYPRGGEADVVGSYDTLEDAKVAASDDISDCHEALDLDEREWIEID